MRRPFADKRPFGPFITRGAVFGTTLASNNLDLDTLDDSKWIVNGKLGYTVYKKIKNSPRVRFADDIAVWAKLTQDAKNKRDTDLVLLSNETVEGPQDWAEPFDIRDPEFRMAFNFSTKLDMDDPDKVNMAVFSRTNNGASFTHEFEQENGEEAEAIIRVPVPDGLREEALEVADRHEGCEMIREQVGAFQERFNVTDVDAPMNYWEPHIECTGVRDQQHMIDVFDDVLDVVERGVRLST